ncbi:hypothetical protein BY996DRAFT_6410377 [Phakopsora pachyrhizi]|nr:hypothetical protein BY996DRAFT_6410377 [Phakopsora pachyrhizi]
MTGAGFLPAAHQRVFLLTYFKISKTQSIDTPGVIERVSTLFRGYPSLIQGFNTFLPPGFRIECNQIRRKSCSSHEADLVTVFSPGGVTNKTSLFPRDGSAVMIFKDLTSGSLPDGWASANFSSESSPNHQNATTSPGDMISKDLSASLRAEISTSAIPSSKNSRSMQPTKHDHSLASTKSLRPSNHNKSHSIELIPGPTSRKRSPHPDDSSQTLQNGADVLSGPLSRKQPRLGNIKTSSSSSTKDGLVGNPSVLVHALETSTDLSQRAPSGRSSNPVGESSLPRPRAGRVTSVQNAFASRAASPAPNHPSSSETNASKEFIAPSINIGELRSNLESSDSVKAGLTDSKISKPSYSTVQGLNQAQSSTGSKPVEFNYAINYVNKIKHRFIDQPEIYKTFLEILQTYQRDGMPIDSVYVKVTHLFSNAVDLLDEFKQFLPDLNNSTSTTGGGLNNTKSANMPANKSHPISKRLPSTAFQNSQASASAQKSQLDKHSIPLAHPQPIANTSHSFGTIFGISSELSKQHRSAPSQINRPPSNTSGLLPQESNACDPHKTTPSRSITPNLSYTKINRHSPSSKLLDPQVISDASLQTFDPQVINSGTISSKPPTPVPSSHLPRIQAHNAPVALTHELSKSPLRRNTQSATLPESILLNHKWSQSKKSSQPHVDEDDNGSPRKKRTLSATDSQNGSAERLNPMISTIKQQKSHSENSSPNPFPSEPFAGKPPIGKGRRLKTKVSISTISPELNSLSKSHGRQNLEAGNTRNFSKPEGVLSHKTLDPTMSEPLKHLHTKSHLSRNPHTFEVLNQSLRSALPVRYSTWNPSFMETHDAMGGRTLTNTKELVLFESIKNYLNDKDTWLEFLRVLELYNLSIIDFKTLLDRISEFVGDNDELLEDFKGLVGYDIKNDGLVKDEVWEIKNRDVQEREKVDATMIQREYGPSYKRLPRAEIDLACSGRDELCWSVLNDEYFGAAKFGTESGGPGHRKTNFEEVVAMTEGERAHFSYWLECISRTIGHLESLRVRIDSMDDIERSNFQLGENLGGQSPSIYHRTLRKVYESKYESSILPYLRDYPATSVPIVLRRLKELELSWKSAESQWNVIWREVEKKNYYKAQDHQVVAFKSEEKLLLKGTNMLRELQELKEKRTCLVLDVALDFKKKPSPIEITGQGLAAIDLDEGNPPFSGKAHDPFQLKTCITDTESFQTPPIRDTHQVELGFQDMDVFFDVLRIVVMSLDRTAMSNPERRRIDETIRIFIPALWNISALDLEKQIPIIYDDESSEPSDDYQSTSQPVESSYQHDLLDKKGVESLTQGLLKIQTAQQIFQDESQKYDTPLALSPVSSLKELGGSQSKIIGTNSTAAHLQVNCGHPYQLTPNEINGAGLGFANMNKWTTISLPSDIVPASYTDPRVKRWLNLFGTSTFYLLLRLLHTLYSRLLKLKTIALQLSEQTPTWRRINPVAIELGLTHAILGVDDHPQPSLQLYPYCLDQLSRYYDGEIDSAQFEESIRVAFPKDGYLLSTVDKLTNAILKQFLQIHQEPRNKELLHLLKRERELNSTSPVTQIAYRNEAQKIVEDSDLIRAEWTETDLLLHYVDTYEYETNTELIPSNSVGTPYLRANLNIESEVEEEDEEPKGKDNKRDGERQYEKVRRRRILANQRGLSVKIDPSSYGMKLVSSEGRSDLLIVYNSINKVNRKATDKGEGEGVEEDVFERVEFNRKERFERWLEKRLQELSDMGSFKYEFEPLINNIK